MKNTWPKNAKIKYSEYDYLTNVDIDDPKTLRGHLETLSASIHSPSEIRDNDLIKHLQAKLNELKEPVDNLISDYVLNNQDRFNQYKKHLFGGKDSYKNLVECIEKSLSEDTYTNLKGIHNLSSTDILLFQTILSYVHNKKMLRVKTKAKPKYGIDYLLSNQVKLFKSMIRSNLDNTKPSWWDFGMMHGRGLIADYIKKQDEDMAGEQGYFNHVDNKHINLTVEDMQNDPIISKDKFCTWKDIKWYTNGEGKTVGANSYDNSQTHFARVLLTFPVNYVKMMEKTNKELFVVDNKIIRSVKFLRNVYDMDCYQASWWQRGKHSWDYRVVEGFIGVKGEIKATSLSLAHLKDVTLRRVGKEVANELDNVDW